MGPVGSRLPAVRVPRMLRTSVISALLLTALASASSARADDCMCLNDVGPWPQLSSETQRLLEQGLLEQGLALEDGLLERALLESFEVGPFFSSDGTLLSSAVRDTRAHRREHKNSGEVLWCASPYDPRCAPATPSPESPHASLSSGPSATTIDRRHDWPLLRSIPIAMNTAEGLSASAGARARVERPPRS